MTHVRSFFSYTHVFSEKCWGTLLLDSCLRKKGERKERKDLSMPGIRVYYGVEGMGFSEGNLGERKGGGGGGGRRMGKRGLGWGEDDRENRIGHWGLGIRGEGGGGGKGREEGKYGCGNNGGSGKGFPGHETFLSAAIPFPSLLPLILPKPISGNGHFVSVFFQGEGLNFSSWKDGERRRGNKGWGVSSSCLNGTLQL